MYHNHTVVDVLVMQYVSYHQVLPLYIVLV